MGANWTLQSLLLLTALGGCCNCPCAEQANSAADVNAEAEPAQAETEPPPADPEPAEMVPSAPEPTQLEAEPDPAPTKAALPEPSFTPGMSVSEAIAAVPKGWEYSGIEAEALGRPLSDLSLYEPCKLTPAHHFKLRVAVWDGRAVGIDVTSPNKVLARCIKEQVSQVQWREKVKAINTVDFSY